MDTRETSRAAELRGPIPPRHDLSQPWTLQTGGTGIPTKHSSTSLELYLAYTAVATTLPMHPEVQRAVFPNACYQTSTGRALSKICQQVSIRSTSRAEGNALGYPKLVVTCPGRNSPSIITNLGGTLTRRRWPVADKTTFMRGG